MVILIYQNQRYLTEQVLVVETGQMKNCQVFELSNFVDFDQNYLLVVVVVVVDLNQRFVQLQVVVVVVVQMKKHFEVGLAVGNIGEGMLLQESFLVDTYPVLLNQNVIVVILQN